MTEAERQPVEQQHISLLWAGPETAPEIVQIQEDVQFPSWGEDGVRDLLADPCSSSLLAKVRLQSASPPVAAGYIMGRIAADEVEILSIGVLRPFQKFGIGRQLVEGLMRAAQRGEAKKLFLEVAVDNEPAIALYSKLGFVEAGRRNGYYKKPDGVTVDALLMARAV